MDRGAWQATVRGVTKTLDTNEQLALLTFSPLRELPEGCSGATE